MSGDSFGQLYVDMSTPSAYALVASRADSEDTFDFTTVSAAVVKVRKPSGILDTWTTVLSAQTTTGLTATHEFEAGDLDEAGKYTAYLLMTVSGGTDRTETTDFYVKEEYAL
jgi:hypothetical protein